MKLNAYAGFYVKPGETEECIEDFVGHICIQWRTLKNVQTESASEHVVKTVTYREFCVFTQGKGGEVTLLRHMRKALH